MVSGGCVISGGQVRRSLLFSGVRVEERALVEDSVVLTDCTIGANSRIRKAIIDRGCQIPDGTVIGEDPVEDRRRGFRISENGVVLVTPDMLGLPVHFAR